MKEGLDIRRLLSRHTPLVQYHGVPAGWSRAEMVARHRGMGGTYPIGAVEATEPGAPSWMPDRYNWLQYRETLYGIARGIKAGDLICVEMAILYIELNYFGSYSGYVRARFARLLKPAHLGKNQIARLKRCFDSLIGAKQFLPEFQEYNRLRRRLGILSEW